MGSTVSFYRFRVFGFGYDFTVRFVFCYSDCFRTRYGCSSWFTRRHALMSIPDNEIRRQLHRPYVVIDFVVACLNESLELFVPSFDLHLSNVWPLGRSELEESKETRDIYRQLHLKRK